MGIEKPPLHYWDSCIFLAHLHNEVDKHGSRSVNAINELMILNENHKVKVIGCHIVRIEVLDFNLPQDQLNSFNAFYGHDSNEILDIDVRIAEIAREIRDYYKQNKISNSFTSKKGKSVVSERGIKTPDALHIATAIVYEADEMITLDEGGQDNFSLTQISGSVADRYPLKISRPENCDALKIGGLFEESEKDSEEE